ncbi:hypothetical protein P5673_012780 [Acropora cervicornis]|uniref:Uncharacterized protein n=1 Tax=Acropora cervicornis TaxID=6130 RepID=A0AAD9V7E0_ACRCE|nr:hypothetical protein P5673_012780 [Acropora cervicornis]
MTSGKVTWFRWTGFISIKKVKRDESTNPTTAVAIAVALAEAPYFLSPSAIIITEERQDHKIPYLILICNLFYDPIAGAIRRYAVVLGAKI